MFCDTLAPRITPDLEIRWGNRPPCGMITMLWQADVARRATGELQTLPSPNTFRTRDMLSLVANALPAEQVISIAGSGTTNPSKFFWEARLQSRAKT